MSFSKTVSVFAALASIFGAGAAGWKLSQDNQMTPPEDVTQKYEQQITELKQQVSTLQQQTIQSTPQPVVLPQPTVVKQTTPVTPQLPPPPAPVPPKPFE